MILQKITMHLNKMFHWDNVVAVNQTKLFRIETTVGMLFSQLQLSDYIDFILKFSSGLWNQKAV